MSDFDPYHKWLGISPQHQPPNHYRLLSLDLYESDAEVIEAAVDRIVAFLQDVAVGPQAKESQKLLNEIAAARLCLLDAAQKAAYDEKVRAELTQAIMPSGDESEAAPAPPVAPAFAIDTGANSVAKPPAVSKRTKKRPAVATASRRAVSSTTGKPTKRGKQAISPPLLLSLVAGGGLLVVAIVFVVLAGSNSAARRRAAEEAQVRERLDSFAEMGRQGDSFTETRREAESMIPDFEPQFDFNPPPPAKKKRKNKKN